LCVLSGVSGVVVRGRRAVRALRVVFGHGFAAACRLIGA